MLLSVRGFSSYIGSYCFMIVVSSLSPSTLFGFSLGLGAFKAAPETPHLGYFLTYFLYRFNIAVTSISPMKLHFLHLNTLCPFSTSFLPHLWHFDDVSLGLTLTALKLLSLASYSMQNCVLL